MLKIKRAYEKPEKEDGFRILVDMMCPRGMSKEKEDLDYWAKDIAPTPEIRLEFAHKPENFPAFKKNYLHELEHNPVIADFLQLVEEKLANGNVTLIYGAEDQTHNNAIVLYDYIAKKIKS